MATYKIKKKTATSGTTEEILLPISSIDGLQTVLNTIPDDYVAITLSADSGTLSSEQLSVLKAFPHKVVFVRSGFYYFAENLSSSSTWYYSCNVYYNGPQIVKRVVSVNTTSGAYSKTDMAYSPTASQVGAATSTHTHTVDVPSAISSSFTGASMTSTGTFKPSGSISAISHTPAGTISKPNINVSSDTSLFLNGASLSASLASDVLTLSVVTDEAEAMTSATASLESAPTFTGKAFSVTPTFTGTSATVSVSGTTTGSVSSSISSTTTKTTSQPS